MMSQRIRNFSELAIGIVAGAVVWFLAGLAALASANYFGSWAVVGADLLVTIALGWYLLRRRGLNFFVAGMLTFFIGVLLIPGPCSIYSLGGWGY